MYPTGLISDNALGGTLVTGASATVPSVLSASGDFDTGLGRAAADQLSHIA